MSTAQQSYLLVISATAEVIPSSGARALMNSVCKMRISVTVDLWYDFTHQSCKNFDYTGVLPPVSYAARIYRSMVVLRPDTSGRRLSNVFPL